VGQLGPGGRNMRRQLAALAAAVLLGTVPAGATEGDSTGAADSVSVVVDKAHVMHLEADAEVVLIANPAIADVVIDSPRLIFILGISAGETSLFIFDSNREEILHSNVVVVPPAAATPAIVAAPSNGDDAKPQVSVVKVLRRTDESMLSCAPRCAQGAGGAQQ